MAKLSKTDEVAIQIVAITKELQNSFNCRTELKIYREFFSLNVYFCVNIHKLDLINSICSKADEFYFWAQGNCVCLNLNFFLEDEQ